MHRTRLMNLSQEAGFIQPLQEKLALLSIWSNCDNCENSSHHGWMNNQLSPSPTPTLNIFSKNFHAGRRRRIDIDFVVALASSLPLLIQLPNSWSAQPPVRPSAPNYK